MIETVAAQLEFDEASHTYRVGDRRLLSVTEVLRMTGIIKTDYYTDEACVRGRYVAQATAFYDSGELDEDSVDPAVRPYLDAWIAFREQSGAEILTVEESVCNTNHGYAGTLDRRIVWQGHEWIADIKTGAREPWHGLQVAGYAGCFSTRKMRCGIYLNDAGIFKVHPFDDLNELPVFLANVAVANWKLNNGVK